MLARLVGRSRPGSRERGRSTTAHTQVPGSSASSDASSQRAAPTTPIPAVIPGVTTNSFPATTLAAPGLICLTPDLEEEQLSTESPDIVAIHGINGHPIKTWTHEKGAFWLRDFLPEQIPGARVFSFGYDAQVAFTTSRARLDDYARSLLNGLKRYRSVQVGRLRFTLLSIDIIGPPPSLLSQVHRGLARLEVNVFSILD